MTLGSLMAIMEPAMVILMAVMVGFIVIAVLLPIVKMNSLVG
jgi:general secretion pathway protein F